MRIRTFRFQKSSREWCLRIPVRKVRPTSPSHCQFAAALGACIRNLVRTYTSLQWKPVAGRECLAIAGASWDNAFHI